ncbi:toxin-antitoxin system, antitoxin component, Xre family protein [Veillonella montpellierensis]|uniref:toxin-antitoxin system, antitoxin component, Xre family protein n=1 Tax=Veillonella montpellierensis TaxID=187328 RepID=UPI0023F84BC2|nr:toxin-antitoxin system, antitoxin component, Xre family protein [Veillonella montpellierensis]
MAYNSQLLKNRIDKSGVKLKFLAVKLGISPYGLKLKLDGVNEFKNSEIINISEALNLTTEERDSIFFS